MPIQVPIYEKQVNSAALPGYRQNINDPTPEALAKVGQGVARVGEGMAEVDRVNRKSKEEQDQAAAMEGYQKLATTKQALLDDPTYGFLAQKGKDAGANYQGFVDNFKKEADDIAKGLANDEQRKAFGSIAFRENLGFVDSIDRHVADQADAVRKQAFSGAVTAAQGDAVGASARGDYHQIEPAIETVNHAVEAMAQQEGWDKTYAAAQKRTLSTQARLGVLDAMVDAGRVSDAKEYLSTVKPELDGELLAKSNIEKRIANFSTKDAARAMADEEWRKSGGDPVKSLDGLRARNLTDTTLFDETEQRLHQRAQAEAQSRRLADTPRIARLDAQILQSASGRFSRTSDDWLYMNDEGKDDVLRMEKAEMRARREAGSKERSLQSQLDKEAEADFRARDLIGNAGADQASVDIASEYPDASSRQRNLLVERQKNVQRQREKGNGVPMADFERQAKEVAAKVKMPGIDGDTIKKGSKASDFMRYMKDAYVAWVQDPKNEGKKAPPAEVVRKMIGDAALYGERAASEGFLQPNMYQFEAQQQNVPFTPFDQPPPPPQPASPPASAPAGKAVLVGPGGKKTMAPDGPQLDTWLAAHPDWKRQ